MPTRSRSINTSSRAASARPTPASRTCKASWLGSSSSRNSRQVDATKPSPADLQRSHVLTHAAGLLMHRILDDKSAGGLALRRCQWFTNSKHVKSQAAAKRLGFTHEGVLRAHRVLLPGREGARRKSRLDYSLHHLLTTAGRKGEREDCPSRDTWVASVFWEEWENGVKEHVDALMARKQ